MVALETTAVWKKCMHLRLQPAQPLLRQCRRQIRQPQQLQRARLPARVHAGRPRRKHAARARLREIQTYIS